MACVVVHSQGMATYVARFALPTHVAWLSFATPTGMPDLSSDPDYRARFTTRRAAFVAAQAYVNSSSGSLSWPFDITESE